MVHMPVGVSESEATGKTAAIFADIKSTLRVPIVSLMFRILARYPDYLQVAWQELKPNAQTLYFEQQADEIRRYAVEAVRSLGQSPELPEAASSVLRIFHYVNPKLLLAIGALRSATSGQLPRLQALSPDLKRQIQPGIPAEAGNVDLVALESASPETTAVFDDIRRTLDLPVVNSQYLALAQWPDYLRAAWQALKPVTESPDYPRIERTLLQYVDQTISALPYRMTITPHALRQSGLSESDLDGIHAALRMFHAALPGMVAGTAFLSVGAFGHEAAESPFPATTM